MGEAKAGEHLFLASHEQSPSNYWAPHLREALWRKKKKTRTKFVPWEGQSTVASQVLTYENHYKKDGNALLVGSKEKPC